jgi:uncharacterized delta-60 repeat protein
MWKRYVLSLVIGPLAVIACSSFSADEPKPAPELDASAEAAPPLPPPPSSQSGIDFVFPAATGPLYVKQSGELEIFFEMKRSAASSGPIAVTVSLLPSEVTADPITIPAGETKGRVLVRATSKAAQGPSTLAFDAVENVPNGAKAHATRSIFVRGMPGTLDQTFVNGGVVTDVYAPVASAGTIDDVRVDAKGAIFLSGQRQEIAGYHIAVTKLTPSGARDMAFGKNAVLDVPGAQAATALDIHDIAPAPAGVIEVMTGGPQNVALYRVQTDGTPIASFKNTNANPPGLSIASGQQVVGLNDGKVLLLAHFDSPKTFAVSRWLSNGSLDGTYGAAGSCGLDGTGTASAIGGAARMFVRADGSARVVLGLANDKIIVKGCTAGGALDATIGSTADHFVDAGTGTFVDAARTATDEILVLSTKPDGSGQWRKLTKTLAVDASVGTVATPVGSAIIAAADGGVIVGGGSDNGFAIVRHTASGPVDTSFGVQGVLTVPVAGTNVAILRKLAQQADGRILAVGSQYNTADGAIVRFWP